MYYLYILKSERTGTYYVGQTNDLERRLAEHNTKVDSKFTNRHQPWQLVASFELGEDRRVALKVEHHIKKQKSREYIEELVSRGSISRIIEKYVNP